MYMTDERRARLEELRGLYHAGIIFEYEEEEMHDLEILGGVAGNQSLPDDKAIEAVRSGDAEESDEARDRIEFEAAQRQAKREAERAKIEEDMEEQRKEGEKKLRDVNISGAPKKDERPVGKPTGRQASVTTGSI